MKLNKKYLIPFVIFLIIFLGCGAATLGSEIAPHIFSDQMGNIGAICLVPVGFILMILTLKLAGHKRKSQSDEIQIDFPE